MLILMKLLFRITSLAIIASLFFLMAFASITHDPHWHIEEQAVASTDYPLAGFWKQGRCEDPWGWAIGPASQGLYYISFCGPGGCFDSNEYRPNTPILKDPQYQVVDNDTLRLFSEGHWMTVIRCASRN